MKIGYARCSTTAQGLYGSSLEEQTEKLKAEGCDKIITEVYSGGTTKRPQFSNLILALNEGDELVVCKLDRFARSVSEGIATIEDLFNRGIKVNILNMGIIEDSTVGRLILDIMLSFAEYERALIKERCMSGREIMRQDPNYHEGRPKSYTSIQAEHVLELVSNGKSYKQISRMLGLSKSTVYRIVKIKKESEHDGGTNK